MNIKSWLNGTALCYNHSVASHINLSATETGKIKATKKTSELDQTRMRVEQLADSTCEEMDFYTGNCKCNIIFW